MTGLTVLCIALVALLAYREWGAARDRAQAAEERAAAAREQAEERLRHAAERRELYQRIQDPETAVSEHVRESRPQRRKARPIAADDDAAYAAREKPERG